MSKENLSRRQFISGAAMGTAGVAVMGMMSACAPKVTGNGAAAGDAQSALVNGFDETTAKITATYDTDVVIIGAGAAGLMAGMNLARAGRKVIIIEKGPTNAVANFANCGGPAAAETKLQADENATVTVDQMFQHMYAYSRTSVNAALLHNCIANSGKAINDMLDLGIPMVLNPDTYGVGFRARHMLMARGQDRVQPIIDDITKNGGQMMTATAGAKIIMKDGQAAGVYATTNDGAIQINAKAVLVSTGGFQGSPEKIEKFMGVKNLVSLGNNLCTGDGIEMVQAAGGVLDRNFCTLGNEGCGSNHKCEGGPYSAQFGMTNANLAFAIYGNLMVDTTGDRFMNEKKIADFPLALGGEALLRAGHAYVVMDAAYYEACSQVGIYEYLGKPSDWISGPALWFPVVSDAPAQLDKAISEGWAFKADTLAECAEHFNLTNLEATVTAYNQLCDAGEDTQFGKSPNFLKKIGDGPYYVIEYEPATWSTNGGIKINQHCQVIDNEGSPVPGLYLAGVDNGSVYTAPYYDNEGASVGMALGSGVLVSQSIDSYLG